MKIFFPCRRGYLTALAVCCSLLAGCATPGDRQAQQLDRDVNRLSQKMLRLTDQLTAIKQQKKLNQQPVAGAWLIPTAATPELMPTRAGELRLWLTDVTTVADGSQLTLHLQRSDNRALPRLRGKVQWGKRDNDGLPQTDASATQAFQLTAPAGAGSAATLLLHLPTTPPALPDYVRIYDVVAQ